MNAIVARMRAMTDEQGRVAGEAATGHLSPMPPPAVELQRQLIRAMSPERKVRAAEALRAAVWDLKAAWIRSRHPELPEAAVQDAVRRWFRDAPGA